MRHNKRKRKKPFDPELLFILFGIAILFLSSHPSLRSIRNSQVFAILIKALISGVVLFFTWVWKKRPPLFEKITLSIAAAIPWIGGIIKSHNSVLLFQMILFYALLIASIKHFVTDKKYTTITSVVTIFLGGIILRSTASVTYLHNSRGFHFWKIGLIAAVFVTVICITLIVKKKIYLKDDRISETIASFLLIFGGTFALVAFTIGNLNYSLDRSKPIAYTATVLEKEIHSSSRGAKSYVLITDINNERKEFYVSESNYFNLPIGTRFPVQLYEGAFGHEYYTYYK